MIVLELTSQTNKAKVFIAAESVSVSESVGEDFYTKKPNRGCYVIDGKHNNGGWKVEESYAAVVKMIRAQTTGGK